MKPLFEVRLARIDTDIPAITDIIQQCNHEDCTVESVREWMERSEPGRVAQHYVCVDDQDTVIGYGQIIHTVFSPANLFYAWVGVNPPFRRQGIGSAVWKTLLTALREQHADRLVCEVFEKESEGRTFAEKCGFAFERRLFHSTLDLATFDETAFLPIIAALQSQGIRFCTLADLPDDSDTQRKYYELNLATVRDIPGEYWDFAAYPQFFKEHIRGAAWFRREGEILALDGDTFAGFASVIFSSETQSAYNHTTGVMRDYRGRGIGLALKVLAARYARARGARQVATDNDSRNTPILTINRKMGYQPEPGKSILTRQLTLRNDYMIADFFSPLEPLPIEELNFRYTCGSEDAEALHTVQYKSVAYDADNEPHIMNTLPTCEDMAGWLENAAKEGRANDWLVAQVADKVIGYNEMMSWKEAVSDDDITWVYLNVGWVLPEWRGKGLATAMLHSAENEIRRRAAVEHPGEKVEFAANADTYEKEAAVLLLHEGYHVAFTRLDLSLDPSFPLPPPNPLPAGIEVRPVEPEHIPLIHASIVEAYRNENTVCRMYNPEGNLAGLRNPRHNLSLWQVAWDYTSGAGEVVGQVIPVIEKGRGEIFEVSVRPAWRRRGLARCLLLRALHILKQPNIQDIWLCTISEFPTHAKELYQSVGFRITKESPRYRKAF